MCLHGLLLGQLLPTMPSISSIALGVWHPAVGLQTIVLPLGKHAATLHVWHVFIVPIYCYAIKGTEHLYLWDQEDLPIMVCVGNA